MALLAPRKNDSDLFAETTMSFGEHLEELRVCLWKAVLGLVIGFMIGLAVGKQAVAVISRPLEKALTSYYSRVALERWDASKKELGPELAGLMPYEVKELQNKIDQGMIFELRYVDSNDLARSLGLPRPTATPTATASATPTPAATPTGTPSLPGGAIPENGAAVPVDAMKLAGLMPLLVWQQQKDDDRTRPKSFSATEPFMIWMKASFVVGALVSAPWVFYQVWIFVAAGLYHHERKYIYMFLPFSLGLFFAGAATAYLFVFAPVLEFLFEFNSWLGIDPDPRINEWLSFVILMPLGFGVSFQLPLVMLFLDRINVFTAKDYVEKWRIAVLAIFVISAVLTPADPYSIFLMAVPLTFLYFGGILLCMYLPKVGRPQPV